MYILLSSKIIMPLTHNNLLDSRRADVALLIYTGKQRCRVELMIYRSYCEQKLNAGLLRLSGNYSIKLIY